MEKLSSFNNLSDNIKQKIIENFMHVANQDTSINHYVEGNPDIFDKTENADKSFTTDANALACLARLNKKSAQLAKSMEKRYPSAGLGASRERILKMQDMGAVAFSQNFASLIANNGNVSVPLDQLCKNKVYLCLAQLSAIEDNQLKNVKLTINKHYANTKSTMSSTLWMNVVRKMREKNPQAVIELNLGEWRPESYQEGKEFASILHLCKVKKLDFDGASVSSDIIIAISESLVSAGVRKLDLTNGSIDNQAAFTLAQGLRNSQLESLDLTDTELEEDGLLEIIKALPHSKLKCLNIEGSNIDLKVMKALAFILPMTQLTKLRVSPDWDTLDARGVKALMDAVPKSQLTELMLWHAEINESTLQSIVQAIQHSKLTDFEISRSNLGDAGAIAIAESLSQSSITKLALLADEIGDNGVKALEIALVDSKLDYLNLEENGDISQAGLEGLRQAILQRSRGFHTALSQSRE